MITEFFNNIYNLYVNLNKIDERTEELDALNTKIKNINRELDILQLAVSQKSDYIHILDNEARVIQKEIDQLKKEKGVLTMYR